MIATLVLVGLAFLAGAIPFGVFVARRRGIAIQDHGSGNIGATNVARVLGLGAGALVLVLDAGKGALAVVGARWLSDDPWTIALTGFAAIAGHCFSPFLGGKGGKGVATAFGVFLVLAPRLALVAIIVFGIVLRLTRVPALGSLAAIVAITAALVAHGHPACVALGCATTALLVYTHRTNLAKLRAR
jgi:acyl phosphate:glycerol-3-phosphate acyltransferase